MHDAEAGSALKGCVREEIARGEREEDQFLGDLSMAVSSVSADSVR